MKFVYHNHRFEFVIDLQKCIRGNNEMTDPKEFGLLVDTYWVQAGGAN